MPETVKIKLQNELKMIDKNRSKLIERLHQARGDITPRQWKLMHFERDGYDKLHSVLQKRIEEL